MEPSPVSKIPLRKQGNVSYVAVIGCRVRPVSPNFCVAVKGPDSFILSVRVGQYGQCASCTKRHPVTKAKIPRLKLKLGQKVVMRLPTGGLEVKKKYHQNCQHICMTSSISSNCIKPNLHKPVPWSDCVSDLPVTYSTHPYIAGLSKPLFLKTSGIK